MDNYFDIDDDVLDTAFDAEESVGSQSDTPTGIMTEEECEGINGNRPTVYDSDATQQTLVSDDNSMGIEMSNAEYHNSGKVGSTMLGILMDNALRYKMIKDGTIKFESEAFDMGTVLHTMVLESHENDNVFIVEDLEILRAVKKIVKENLDFIAIPEEFLTASGAVSKAKDNYQRYEEFKYANRNKILVSGKDVDMIKYLKDTEHLIRISTQKKEELEIAMNNVKQLQDFQECLDNGYKERTFHATLLYCDECQEKIDRGEEPDEDCENCIYAQCRCDLFYAPDPSKPKEIVVIDLKTTAKEATNDEFLKSSASFNYYGQEALYTTVMEAEENGFIVIAFYFAYASRLIYGGASYQEHSEVDKELGRTFLSKALAKHRYCKEHDLYLVNNFNGTDYDFIGRGSLPSYVHYKYNY